MAAEERNRGLNSNSYLSGVDVESCGLTAESPANFVPDYKQQFYQQSRYVR